MIWVLTKYHIGGQIKPQTFIGINKKFCFIVGVIFTLSAPITLSLTIPCSVYVTADPLNHFHFFPGTTLYPQNPAAVFQL